MTTQTENIETLCDDLNRGRISETHFCQALESRIQNSEIINWESFARIGKELAAVNSDRSSRIWKLADRADSNIRLYFEAVIV